MVITTASLLLSYISLLNFGFPWEFFIQIIYSTSPSFLNYNLCFFTYLLYALVTDTPFQPPHNTFSIPPTLPFWEGGGFCVSLPPWHLKSLQVSLGASSPTEAIKSDTVRRIYLTYSKEQYTVRIAPVLVVQNPHEDLRQSLSLNNLEHCKVSKLMLLNVWDRISHCILARLVWNSLCSSDTMILCQSMCLCLK